MGSAWSFCVRFSGITVRFDLPGPIALPPAFRALRCEDDAAADDIYKIHLLTEPLTPTYTTPTKAGCASTPLSAMEGDAR